MRYYIMCILDSDFGFFCNLLSDIPEKYDEHNLFKIKQKTNYVFLEFCTYEAAEICKNKAEEIDNLNRDYYFKNKGYIIPALKYEVVTMDEFKSTIEMMNIIS